MQRLIVMLLAAAATALGVEASPETWFNDTWRLALFVGAAVAFLRRTVTIDGFMVVVVSVVTGVVLALVGWQVDLFAAGTQALEAVAFGVTAGWLASGGVDLLRSMTSKVTVAALPSNRDVLVVQGHHDAQDTGVVAPGAAVVLDGEGDE